MAAFQPGSGRETLAPLGAAALEDRATGAGRHPRAESVPALPASNVRLEGAFHEARREEMWTAGLRRPRASIEKRGARTAPEVITADALCKKFERHEIHRLKTA